MELSLRLQHHNHDEPQQQSVLPSPNSHKSSNSNSSRSNSNRQTPPLPLPSPKPIQTRSDPTSPYPTTFVQADTSSFKQVVQMLTGSPKPPTTQQPDPTRPAHFNIPPIKSIPKKTQASSGFKLYERRNSLKNLKINPLINPIFSQCGSGFSPRKPEILSPTILDFPSLVLSPVTPLIPDPFDRSSSGSPAIVKSNPNNTFDGSFLDKEAEEKAIKEKGFYLHPSPATTPREATADPPRLLPLFPVTSPRV